LPTGDGTLLALHVEEFMKNRIGKAGAIAAAATLFLSSGPASAQQGTPVYGTTYYSDATHQNQVGSLLWTGCDDNDNPTFRRLGSSSVYQVTEQIGYCLDGQMQPL
jgi:hypothetical protein